MRNHQRQHCAYFNARAHGWDRGIYVRANHCDKCGATMDSYTAHRIDPCPYCAGNLKQVSARWVKAPINLWRKLTYFWGNLDSRDGYWEIPR